MLHITAKATWGKTLKTFFRDKYPTSFCDLRAEFQQKFFLVFQSRLLFSRCKEVHLKVAHTELSYHFTMIFPSHNLLSAFVRAAEWTQHRTAPSHLALLHRDSSHAWKLCSQGTGYLQQGLALFGCCWCSPSAAQRSEDISDNIWVSTAAGICFRLSTWTTLEAQAVWGEESTNTPWVQVQQPGGVHGTTFTSSLETQKDTKEDNT